MSRDATQEQCCSLCLFHPECQAWELETGGFCRLLQTTAGPGLALSANDYTLVGILKSHVSDARASSRGRSGRSALDEVEQVKGNLAQLASESNRLHELREVRKAAQGPGAPAAAQAPAAGASQVAASQVEQGLGGMGSDAVNTRATPAAAAGGVELASAATSAATSAAVIPPQAPRSVKCYTPGGALIKCIEDDEACGDDGSGRGLSLILFWSFLNLFFTPTRVMYCSCKHANTRVDSTRAWYHGRDRDLLRTFDQEAWH